MAIKSSYTFISVLGNDISNELSQYMESPKEELNSLREEKQKILYEFLDKCYENYEENGKKKIEKILSNISNRNYDYDTILELREDISEIYYDMQSISYIELMNHYPRVEFTNDGLVVNS